MLKTQAFSGSTGGAEVGARAGVGIHDVWGLTRDLWGLLHDSWGIIDDFWGLSADSFVSLQINILWLEKIAKHL